MANNQTLPTPHAPLAGARSLAAPCGLTVTREHEPSAVPCSIYINGQYAGGPRGGEHVRGTTTLVQNVAVTQNASGGETVFCFAVPSGGEALLVLGGGRFIPERCEGIIPLSEADVRALPYAAPGQAFGIYRPAAFAPPPPENPAWAIRTLCAALLFMLLSAFTFMPRSSASYDQTSALVSLSLPLLFAACICLMARREAAYKALASGGLIIGAAIHVFSSRYLLVYASTLRAPPINWLLRDQGFLISLRQTMVITVAVCIIALIVSVAHSGPARKKIVLSAWISTAVLIAMRYYYARYLFTRPDILPIRKFGIFMGIAESGVCIALFALLIYALCAPKRHELVTGTGAKVWLCVCMLATAGVLIVGIAAGTMGIASALVAIAAVTGCILLHASRRAGFLLMLIAVILNVATGVSVGLNGRYPSVLNALIPLAGLLNPLITWLIIRERWNDASNRAF